jgi:hypothetical protein
MMFTSKPDRQETDRQKKNVPVALNEFLSVIFFDKK